MGKKILYHLSFTLLSFVAELPIGPFVFVENLGIPILFLNSYDAIVELFDKRGNIYSSRPASVMFELYAF